MRKLIVRLAPLFLITSLCFAQAPSRSTPDLEQKVNAIVGKMSLEQKIDMLGGINTFDVRGYPELGLPLLHTADGPLGVRNDGPATAMAGGISLASSWDPALAQRVGEQIGRDARSKGKHFMLGPGVNIYRSPLNGRNFEYFGEDPFLGSRIAVGYIEGMQSQGVSATIKHYMGNNSEFDRHNADSIIDERTMREIYLPIFEAAVKEAHVGAVMDSYNLTNGQHMTQNGYLNNDVLKKDWGFQGVLMSDWDATYDAVGAANGGMDLEMPSGKFFNREKLLPAVKSGQVSEETINDKVRRIIRTELEFGWNDRDQRDLSIARFNQDGREVAVQAAREGMVLLKNEGDVLPLDKNKIKTIAVIGPDGYPAVPVGGGSAQVKPFIEISFLQGLSDTLGSKASVTSASGIMSLGLAAIRTNFQTDASNGKPGLKLEHFDNENLSGAPSSTGSSQHISVGMPFDLGSINFEEIDFSSLMHNRASSERWTGYYVPEKAGTFDIFVQQGGFSPSGFRMYLDDKLLLDNWSNQKFIVAQAHVSLDAKPHKVVFEHRTGPGFGQPFVRMGIVPEHNWVDAAAEELAAKADAVVLAVGFTPHSETEGWDRTFELPPGQNELIQRIAAKNKNTIVVVTSGGGVDMTSWIDKVPGVIEAWYPGQEGGRALTEILFGDVNPSGHLAATFEHRWEDNPTYNNYYPEKGTNRVVYKEGVFVGYRGYEHNGTKPLFPFGYGLSYTTFKYANLKADEHSVSFDVTNTGSRAGDAVAQLYIAPPSHEAVPRPQKELKGFSRVSLQPGETKSLTLPLNTRSFAYYDVNGKEWRAEKGTYEVLVGSSSEDIALRGTVQLGQELTEK
ncbi:MAG TPA: glycoside hydrolase family 3 C-terminal domain-containing protein [Terriglobales bacterium]|nr:glycoside hydrolase family 3 C-terminal domain-containing protein [Terriglobales bacterium]